MRVDEASHGQESYYRECDERETEHPHEDEDTAPHCGPSEPLPRRIGWSYALYLSEPARMLLLPEVSLQVKAYIQLFRWQDKHARR